MRVSPRFGNEVGNICPYSIFGQLTMSEHHLSLVPGVNGSSFRSVPVFPLPVSSIEVAAHACTLVLVHTVLPTNGCNFQPTHWTHPGANELNVHTGIIYMYTSVFVTTQGNVESEDGRLYAKLKLKHYSKYQ